MSHAGEGGHAWMTPGMPLAKQHLLSDYYQAYKQDELHKKNVTVEGVVYVETDVRYDKLNGDLRSWARGPLDEIKFLRDVAEGKYGERDRQSLVGIVAWAPMDQSTSVLEEWLRLAEETAGRETWKRVKGFRFLLQFIHDQKAFETLVWSDHFMRNLQLLGRRGLAFDVGVDQHSGGVWQLQAMATAMEKAHLGVPEAEKVTFVINHLCKPEFLTGGAEFGAWTKATQAMAARSKTYMKLSGGLSELPEEILATKDAIAIAKYMKPWVEHAFEVFGPERIMFGSDWPVCNVRGPGEEASWTMWREIVADLIENQISDLSDAAKASVWSEAARCAYNLD
ncbi:hypothetical protein CERZMDRAFT_56684 [Cercospora zeae-maydis SCOH1-5]|uniref:Amidohydrolase-related domain-containing protein n=1 Tax=Cercospora zeae-maydis SCOH1-5 TaxID=717836 RepID=A0A6A6FRI9_9PEZI|nr:hypothetical protein CERZMDRAFT_56684 [Cercospora zeae-maydis SCOH1-5]